MPSGSCLCGQVKISFDGDTVAKALCHCGDCRKISGSAYSTNLVVKPDGFEVTGSPKAYTKTADSGKSITSFFCPECGGTLYRQGEAFGDNKIIKAGVLDDKGAMADVKPAAEFFAAARVPWLEQVKGAEDIAGMP